MILFHKMHGLGNDFVIIDQRNSQTKILSKGQITLLCNRHYGIGCDQLVILQNAKGFDAKMLIYNQDGSQASACGNAARCVALLIEKKNSLILMHDTPLKAWVENEDSIRIEWESDYTIQNIELDVLGYKQAIFIDIANPHLIFFLPDLKIVDVDKLGPFFEKHERFPTGVNVSFCQVLNRKEIEAIIWERGAGKTLACGSAACAIQLAAHTSGMTENQASIRMPGGELIISVENDRRLCMVGSACHVFAGRIYIPLINHLRSIPLISEELQKV